MITLQSKEKAVVEKTQEPKPRINLVLPCKANLTMGLDKGGEVGITVGWTRLGKLGAKTWAEALALIAGDLATLARKQGFEAETDKALTSAIDAYNAWALAQTKAK